MLITILLFAVLTYVLVGLALYFLQSRLLYFPQSRLVATPDDVGLLYTSVVFSATDGTKLSGWYVPAESSRGVVLFFHGNGGNMSYLLETIQQYHSMALETFVFDYRGYGESEGRPFEAGTYLDAVAAWHYLADQRGVSPADIILVGRSLGGAIAAWLAQRVTPRALVIESAFTSVPDIAASVYRFFPTRPLTRFKYNTLEYLQHITCPVLIVHSPGDEIIPFSHGRRLFEAAKKPKDFLEISGGHNDGFTLSRSQYERGLENFLSTYAHR